MPALYPVRVSRVSRLTPPMNRGTVTGPGVSGYLDAGPDQRIKVLLPRPGLDRPVLPGDPTSSPASVGCPTGCAR